LRGGRNTQFFANSYNYVGSAISFLSLLPSVFICLTFMVPFYWQSATRVKVSGALSGVGVGMGEKKMAQP
jgi:hypothetical protein